MAAVVAVAVAGCGPTPQQKAEQAAAKAKAELERETDRLKEMFVDACKENLQAKLKDPFSLRVISAGARWYGDDYQPAEYFDGDIIGRVVIHPEYNGSAVVEYTAKNGFGGATRDTHVCYFDNERLAGVL